MKCVLVLCLLCPLVEVYLKGKLRMFLCLGFIGGPATTVDWTLHSSTITEGTESLLNDPVTAQYTHTLTVTGRRIGRYKCSVSNEVSSDYSQSRVSVPYSPAGVTVSQNGLDSVRVSWTPPSGGPTMTGYVIYYQQQDGGHTGSEMLGATATTATITGLIRGATYSITMVTTSSTLPSTVTSAVNVNIEQPTVSLTPNILSVIPGMTITLTCSVTLPRGVSGTPNFQWEEPGVITSPTTSGQMTSILTIRRIRTSQAGHYTCISTLNGYNFPSNSKSLTITVQIQVPIPSIVLSNTGTINAGTALNLKCTYSLSGAIDTSIQSSVRWMLKYGSLDISQDQISDDGATLTFSPVTTSDEGEYACQLTITQSQTHVTVQPATRQSRWKPVLIGIPGPEINVILSHSPPLYAGINLTLTCTVTLDPSVDSGENVITEWKGHQNIPQDRYSTSPASRSGNIFTGSLTISPLADQDDGTYTCTGTVKSLEVQKEKTIDVKFPYGAPEMFDADVGEREVIFSWLSPQALAVDPEIVVSYTLSCSPSPSSLPQSISQTELKVKGFSPNTIYSCLVNIVDKNGLGSGPHRNITFETMQDFVYFQIRLGGEFVCSEIIVNSTDTEVMLEHITSAVLESCTNCSITSDIIDMEAFKCFTESPSYVMYRARLEGTTETDSDSFISLIEDWVMDGASINVSGVMMTIDSECLVQVLSIDKEGCSLPSSPSSSPSSSPPSRILYFIIRVGVPAAGVLIGLLLIVIIVIVVMKKCRRNAPKSKIAISTAANSAYQFVKPKKLKKSQKESFTTKPPCPPPPPIKPSALMGVVSRNDSVVAPSLKLPPMKPPRSRTGPAVFSETMPASGYDNDETSATLLPIPPRSRTRPTQDHIPSSGAAGVESGGYDNDETSATPLPIPPRSNTLPVDYEEPSYKRAFKLLSLKLPRFKSSPREPPETSGGVGLSDMEEEYDDVTKHPLKKSSRPNSTPTEIPMTTISYGNVSAVSKKEKKKKKLPMTPPRLNTTPTQSSTSYLNLYTPTEFLGTAEDVDVEPKKKTEPAYYEFEIGPSALPPPIQSPSSANTTAEDEVVPPAKPFFKLPSIKLLRSKTTPREATENVGKQEGVVSNTKDIPETTPPSGDVGSMKKKGPAYYEFEIYPSAQPPPIHPPRSENTTAEDEVVPSAKSFFKLPSIKLLRSKNTPREATEKYENVVKEEGVVSNTTDIPETTPTSGDVSVDSKKKGPVYYEFEIGPSAMLPPTQPPSSENTTTEDEVVPSAKPFFKLPSIKLLRSKTTPREATEKYENADKEKKGVHSAKQLPKPPLYSNNTPTEVRGATLPSGDLSTASKAGPVYHEIDILPAAIPTPYYNIKSSQVSGNTPTSADMNAISGKKDKKIKPSKTPPHPKTEDPESALTSAVKKKEAKKKPMTPPRPTATPTEVPRVTLPSVNVGEKGPVYYEIDIPTEVTDTTLTSVKKKEMKKKPKTPPRPKTPLMEVSGTAPTSVDMKGKKGTEKKNMIPPRSKDIKLPKDVGVVSWEDEDDIYDDIVYK